MPSCIPFRRSSLPIRVTDQTRFVAASTLITSLGLSGSHSARIVVVKAELLVPMHAMLEALVSHLTIWAPRKLLFVVTRPSVPSGKELLCQNFGERIQGYTAVNPTIGWAVVVAMLDTWTSIAPETLRIHLSKEFDRLEAHRYRTPEIDIHQRPGTVHWYPLQLTVLRVHMPVSLM
ncbi:hypothetical protein BDR06DRAFT_1012176 [Suillus hirtellus]|nr:hypothetical protein BDR06DRAFT_1012176 [Suillus hirtellus]